MLLPESVGKKFEFTLTRGGEKTHEVFRGVIERVNGPLVRFKNVERQTRMGKWEEHKPLMLVNIMSFGFVTMEPSAEPSADES